MNYINTVGLVPSITIHPVSIRRVNGAPLTAPAGFWQISSSSLLPRCLHPGPQCEVARSSAARAAVQRKPTASPGHSPLLAGLAAGLATPPTP